MLFRSVQGCTTVYAVRTASPGYVAPTVTAFPNPYIDMLTFTIKTGSTAGLATLKVYDMIGRNIDNVFEGVLEANVEKKVKHNVRILGQPLIYVLTIDGKKVSGRLIPGIPE